MYGGSVKIPGHFTEKTWASADFGIHRGSRNPSPMKKQRMTLADLPCLSNVKVKFQTLVLNNHHLNKYFRIIHASDTALRMHHVWSRWTWKPWSRCGEDLHSWGPQPPSHLSRSPRAGGRGECGTHYVVQASRLWRGSWGMFGDEDTS